MFSSYKILTFIFVMNQKDDVKCEGCDRQEKGNDRRNVEVDVEVDVEDGNKN